MLFSEIDLLADESPGTGARNMAVDEALARLAHAPILRVYRWSEPTVTFGYFEKIATVRDLFPGWPLMRRWTGGGMVAHGQDLTYSLALPMGHPFAQNSASQSYALIHEAIRNFLQQKGYSPTLATDSVIHGEGCFTRPVPADLLLDGQKIAGAAQRRTRDFLLHQGSLQNLPVSDWHASDFARRFAPVIRPRALTTVESDTASELEHTRYQRAEWLQRR